MRVWLKKIREDLKLTLEEAAERCGISKSYFEKIEYGDRNVPVKTAMQIATALGFDWQIFYKEA